MNKYRTTLLICFTFLSLCSAARYWDNTDFILVDILSHFAIQYAFSAIILLVFCIWKRLYVLALLSGFLFFFNVGTFSDIGSSVDASIHVSKYFTVYSANINKNNRELDALISDLNERNAEIVLLIEVTPEQSEELHPVIQAYPYHVEITPRGVNRLGLIMLSRFPILNHSVTDLSIYGNALIKAEILIGEENILFYGVHFPRPGNAPRNSHRSTQFLKIAREIRNETKPSIIAGDFNASPYSPLFSTFRKISGLRDTRRGFGWQPTWPVYFPVLWIPIDHILVSPGIHVVGRSTGPDIGSDHYPVYAELSIF